MLDLVIKSLKFITKNMKLLHIIRLNVPVIRSNDYIDATNLVISYRDIAF